jgi:hypothetical protein
MSGWSEQSLYLIEFVLQFVRSDRTEITLDCCTVDCVKILERRRMNSKREDGNLIMLRAV